MVKFPENFVWGTATSSIQIEGVAPESGKGKNICDIISLGAAGYITPQGRLAQ